MIDIYKLRNRYWPAYTWKIQTAYSTEIKDNLPMELRISEAEFSKEYFHIFDKINASFYHLQNLKKNEKIAIRTGKQLLNIEMPVTKGMIGVIGTPYEPIEYEYEAFLMTIKSSLDFIAILVEHCFGHSEDNIASLVNASLSRRMQTDTVEHDTYRFLQSENFDELINSFRNINRDRKSLRNYAIHKGSLFTGTINIPINNPNAKILHSKTVNPNIPLSQFSPLNSPDLLDYCEGKFYKTCDLLIGVISILISKDLDHGPRGSVLEYKRNLKKEQMSIRGKQYNQMYK